MRDVMEKAARVATDRQSVIIRGPRGSGRKLISRYLHESGSQRHGPLVVVHCARILGSLQESELFGHEPGAFPGAADAAPGVIELAHGGSLVLEEVSIANSLRSRKCSATSRAGRSVELPPRVGFNNTFQ